MQSTDLFGGGGCGQDHQMSTSPTPSPPACLLPRIGPSHLELRYTVWTSDLATSDHLSLKNQTFPWRT